MLPPKTPTPPPSLPQQSRALSSDSGLAWRAPLREDPGTWPACLSAWWASRPVCPGEQLPPPRPAIETKTWQMVPVRSNCYWSIYSYTILPNTTSSASFLVTDAYFRDIMQQIFTPDNSLSSFAGSQANHFKNTVLMFKFTTLKYISVISHLLGQEVDSKGVFGSVCPQLNLSQNLQDRTGDETLQLQCFMLKRLPALTYCLQLTVPDWWRSCSWRRMDVPWRSPGWPACPQPGRWCDYRSSRGSDQPEEEEKDDSCCDCSETEQTNGKKEKTKTRYQTFQPSYLRLDVDLLDSVFGEPAHVDLTVKVSDVADDGVVLHVFKVTEGNTQLLACN